MAQLVVNISNIPDVAIDTIQNAEDRIIKILESIFPEIKDEDGICFIETQEEGKVYLLWESVHDNYCGDILLTINVSACLKHGMGIEVLEKINEIMDEIDEDE